MCVMMISSYFMHLHSRFFLQSRLFFHTMEFIVYDTVCMSVLG